MHDTAEAIGGRLLTVRSRPGQTIVELGARDVNGSIRSYAHPEARYIGVDIETGPGVDLVVSPGSALPFADEVAHIVLASSVFEHDKFFWETFLEMLRITKAGGLIYINAPSNGFYHRYPVDNWRFYPDAGKMLEEWGQRNKYRVTLVESFIADRMDDVWNDFVALFQKEPLSSPIFFLSDEFACTDVWKLGATEPSRTREQTEDMTLLTSMREKLRRKMPSSSPQEQESEKIRKQRRFIAWYRLQGGDTHAAQAYLDELLDSESDAGRIS